MRGRDYDAHRAFVDSAHERERIRATLSAGCNSDCADQGDCTCSHGAWRAPRQPRKPEPRRPGLSFWKRIELAWQSWCAGWWLR